MSARFFISYRRGDSAGHAGRLSDALEQRFGADAIFQDIKDVAPGDDFMRDLERALTSCGAMLVVIGPTWATVSQNGRSRLSDTNDVVRTEVAAALSRSDVLVIPVLVNGAEMPTAEQLPEVLKPLATRQAIELSDSRWSYDVDRLSARLKADLELTPQPVPEDSTRMPVRLLVAIGVLIVAVVALTGVVLSLRSGESSGGGSNSDGSPTQSFTTTESTVDDGLQENGFGDEELGVEERLNPGDDLVSANERYQLLMQTDGNLVIEDLAHPIDEPIWASLTANHPGAFAVMQDDGNFVIYQDGATPTENIWATGTSENPGAILRLTDSGVLVIMSVDGDELFNSGDE